MKIGILTIHNIANFGSIFQALALNKYIRNLGHECEVINYNPFYFRHTTLKSEIGKLLNYKRYKSRVKKYSDFIEKEMVLTPKNYKNYKQLCKNPPKEDLYVAGGDQLWNEFYACGQDDAFKLLFTNGRKISFGTSLGKNEFTEEGLNKLVESVSQYEGIGIRERTGAELLINSNVANVRNVCDPVFLLDKEDYRKYIKEVPVKEKYMFVYLVQSSELLEKAVDYISEKLGLKVVLYAGFVPKCKCDYLIKEMGPDENLSYLVGADYVLSASFHASAFSYMFHKQFLTLLPGKNTNARIEDFLTLIGQRDRMVSEVSEINDLVLKEIDWTYSDSVMNKHISDSKAFLNELIK